MSGRIRYSHSAMTEAEANFADVAQRLLSTIDDRRRDVATAMASYEATGVSDEYAAKERAWTASADRVVSIIGSLRQGMGNANTTASETNSTLRAIGESL